MSMTLEEFIARLETMQREYPADAGETLEKGAKRMVRAVKKATPKSGRKKSSRQHLKNRWKLKMVDKMDAQPVANIKNTAPHYHLVNRGVQNPKDAHGNPKPEWHAALNRHVKFFENAVDANWDKTRKSMEKDFYKRVREKLE